MTQLLICRYVPSINKSLSRAASILLLSDTPSRIGPVQVNMFTPTEEMNGAIEEHPCRYNLSGKFSQNAGLSRNVPKQKKFRAIEVLMVA